MFTAVFLENSRAHIVLKVVIVEGNSNAVEPGARKIFGVGFREEILEKLCKEKLIYFFADRRVMAIRVDAGWWTAEMAWTPDIAAIFSLSERY